MPWRKISKGRHLASSLTDDLCHVRLAAVSAELFQEGFMPLHERSVHQPRIFLIAENIAIAFSWTGAKVMKKTTSASQPSQAGECLKCITLLLQWPSYKAPS